MTFDLLPGQPRDHLRQVMKAYWDGGCRIIDTSPLYGMGEVNAGDFAAALGVGDRMLVSNKLWATGDYLAEADAAERSLEQSMQRLWRNPIDFMHVHNLVNVEQNLPLLRAWKAEGRVRKIGVSHHDTAYFDVIANLIEKEPIDVVQVRYSLLTRQAEARILPLAADKGIAVGVNMPFEKARLFKLVGDRSVPDFAREIGIETWADYFLKWIIAHPSVNFVLPATSLPEHARQNIAALRGTLPDAQLRSRMAQYIERLPGYQTLEQAPWYPGKAYKGVIAAAMDNRKQRLERSFGR